MLLSSLEDPAPSRIQTDSASVLCVSWYIYFSVFDAIQLYLIASPIYNSVCYLLERKKVLVNHQWNFNWNLEFSTKVSKKKCVIWQWIRISVIGISQLIFFCYRWNLQVIAEAVISKLLFYSWIISKVRSIEKLFIKF